MEALQETSFLESLRECWAEYSDWMAAFDEAGRSLHEPEEKDATSLDNLVPYKYYGPEPPG